jgi:alpha-beta hydrolase superfamily lysophospholipase
LRENSDVPFRDKVNAMPEALSRRALLASALLAPQLKAAHTNVWSAEYTAHKGSVSLAMYRKRATAPSPTQPPLPVLFLVHGSSLSARTSYDLTVPGREEYSMMNTFARFGFDVWTMDHENYGKSSRTSTNSDIASGAEDLKAGIDLVLHETRAQKVHLFGESSGGLRAGVFAMQHPETVDRLVLAAFTYKGEGSPTLAKRAEQLDYYRTHNSRLRDREMIHGIYTRDKAGTTDPAIADVVADMELKFGDQVPTGTYLDMTAHLPVVDPARVHAPVLLLRGEYDGIATIDDLSQFYKALPTGDRQFIILPGAAHSLITNMNRAQTMHTVRAFLSMPPSHMVS